MNTDPINEQQECVERVRAAERRTEGPRPCPFCGSAPEVTEHPRLRCPNNLCLIHRVLFTEEAWNTRALPPEPEPQAVAPGESWRMLDVGEVIRESDEWSEPGSDVWKLVERTIGKSVDGCRDIYRRRVAPAPTPTAEELARQTAIQIYGNPELFDQRTYKLILAALTALRQQHAEEVARLTRERNFEREQQNVLAKGYLEKLDALRAAAASFQAAARTTGITAQELLADLATTQRELEQLREARSSSVRVVDEANDERKKAVAERDKALHERNQSLARQAELQILLSDIHDIATSSVTTEIPPGGCKARNTFGQACYGRHGHSDPCIFGGSCDVPPTSLPTTDAERLAAIAERTKAHHTPV